MHAMAREWLILLLALGAMGAGWIRVPDGEGAKRVIGQTARVEIAEAGMEFLGRVDTGAASTSVHAESVRVDGDVVDFVLVNRDGGRLEMRAPLAQTKLVRNAEGSERRVYVELTVRHEGIVKRVIANLNDRGGLTYALLLGRDWLQDDFVVDVSREELLPPEESMESEPADPGDSSELASR
jgi:hypothetical protein